MSRLPTRRRVPLASLPWSSGTDLSVVVTSSSGVTSASLSALIATRLSPCHRNLLGLQAQHGQWWLFAALELGHVRVELQPGPAEPLLQQGGRGAVQVHLADGSV